jgi:hypothetical protein
MLLARNCFHTWKYGMDTVTTRSRWTLRGAWSMWEPNIGAFSLYQAMIKHAELVIAFEPSPDVFRRLAKNLLHIWTRLSSQPQRKDVGIKTKAHSGAMGLCFMVVQPCLVERRLFYLQSLFLVSENSLSRPRSFDAHLFERIAHVSERNNPIPRKKCCSPDGGWGCGTAKR